MGAPASRVLYEKSNPDTIKLSVSYTVYIMGWQGKLSPRFDWNQSAGNNRLEFNNGADRFWNCIVRWPSDRLWSCIVRRPRADRWPSWREDKARRHSKRKESARQRIELGTSRYMQDALTTRLPSEGIISLRRLACGVRGLGLGWVGKCLVADGRCGHTDLEFYICKVCLTASESCTDRSLECFQWGCHGPPERHARLIEHLIAHGTPLNWKVPGALEYESSHATKRRCACAVDQSMNKNPKLYKGIPDSQCGDREQKRSDKVLILK